MTTTLTVDDFNKYIKNKRDLYEACERNGYYLPGLKTSMVTEDYMRHVMTGKAFCPKKVDIRMLPCPRPPCKEKLMGMFRELIEANEWRMVGFDERHVPDKRWLLDVIATFSPGAEIFRKDYLPPVKASKLSEIKAIEVPLDFIKGLPMSQRKSRRKGLRLQKEGLRAQKKERFKIMSKKYSNALLEEEVKEDLIKSKSKSSVRTSTNESAFKAPASQVTPTKRSGGTSNMSSGNKDALNASASSSTQPQHLLQSPGVDERMNDLSIGNAGKKRK